MPFRLAIYLPSFQWLLSRYVMTFKLGMENGVLLNKYAAIIASEGLFADNVDRFGWLLGLTPLLKNGRKSSEMGRTHCEKRRNCSLQVIFPLPTVFQKKKKKTHTHTHKKQKRERKLVKQLLKNKSSFGKGLNVESTQSQC